MSLCLMCRVGTSETQNLISNVCLVTTCQPCGPWSETLCHKGATEVTCDTWHVTRDIVTCDSHRLVLHVGHGAGQPGRGAQRHAHVVAGLPELGELEPRAEVGGRGGQQQGRPGGGSRSRGQRHERALGEARVRVDESRRPETSQD